MTEQEEINSSNEGRYAIWSSDGKIYRLLINEEYYNFGLIANTTAKLLILSLLIMLKEFLNIKEDHF